MGDIINIVPMIQRNRFNEIVLEVIRSFEDISPEDMWLLIEKFYDNQDLIDAFSKQGVI